MPTWCPVAFCIQMKMLCTTEELQWSVNQGSRERVEKMEWLYLQPGSCRVDLRGHTLWALKKGTFAPGSRLWTPLSPLETAKDSLSALFPIFSKVLRWAGVGPGPGFCPQGKAATDSHPTGSLKRMFTVVGSVPVPTLPGTRPHVRPWPKDAWGLPAVLQRWGSPHPKKNPGLWPLEARASLHGLRGVGISPQSDLASELFSR